MNHDHLDEQVERVLAAADPGQNGAKTNVAAMVEASPAATRAKDRRVLYIIDRMQAQEWLGKESERLLAEQWGIPQTTVKSLAQEAGRHLRLVKNPELTREWCLTRLQRIIDSTPSDGAKISAIKVALDHLGGRSWSQNERPYTPTYEETVYMLTRELQSPGPELVEALGRVGVVLPQQGPTDGNG